jgi:hypothetical protein
VYSILVGKSFERRKRLEDNIKMDLAEIWKWVLDGGLQWEPMLRLCVQPLQVV